MHDSASTYAGKTVVATVDDGREVRYQVEDWFDRINGDGVSWMDANGNMAAIVYAMRSAIADLPLDDEVLYGKINGLGVLVHVSEIKEVVGE